MTPVVLIGMMVAIALVLAITWIEPRVLGGPAAPKPAGAATSKEVPAPGHAPSERPLEPVHREERRAPVEPSAQRAA